MSRCRRGRSRRARAASSDFKRAVPRYACVRTAGRYWFGSLVGDKRFSPVFWGFFPLESVELLYLSKKSSVLCDGDCLEDDTC